MSEDLIIRHCSPTLAGIKTGNIFSCPCPCREELLKDLSRLNRMLSSKGVRVLPLRICGGRALIYLYRPGLLKSDFEDKRVRDMLTGYGYLPEKPGACISRLIHRLRSQEDFPHEIGLFLSYPPEDVLGFIHSSGCGHKCSGCWKVYGDKRKAEQTFKRYDFCTKSYVKQWQQGKSIEQLTVAV